MEKSKKYKKVYFSSDVIQKASKPLRTRKEKSDENLDPDFYFSVQRGDVTWNYDSIDEFLADYRVSPPDHAAFRATYSDNSILIYYTAFNLTSDVTITSNDRSIIETVFQIFDSEENSCRLEPLEEESTVNPPVVFIGHGHDLQWRELKDHLQDKHNFEVDAYEVGARAGHSVRDIIQEMLDKSSIALLVMTAEDCMEDGTMRARQNVVHEAGLFQGHLGFTRAIMIVEKGVEDFSNISSIEQIRFSQGNIQEAFGDIVATLNREFGK